VRALVLDAISRLPEKQAAAVTLRVLEEQPYEAVAAALGCTEPTARVHVSRGREKLARRLGPLAPADRGAGGLR
jgi:RNA polymerase sigma-70 factor (ECF subfamily)